MRELKILGLNLKDYSVKESLRLTEQYLNEGALSTVMYLSTPDLVKITNDAVQKECLEKIDITLSQDTGILKAADMLTRNRQREIEDNEFLWEFLRRIARDKKSVYLIADSVDADYELMAMLLLIQGNLNIKGLNTFEAGSDEVINGINDVAPDVIISMMPCEKLLDFLCENHKMINGNIWLGLREGELNGPRRFGVSKLFQQYYNKVFRRKVNKYNQKKAE